MSKLTDKKINNHIKSAISELTPDKAEELWNTPVEVADENAWFLKTEPKRKKSFPYYAGTIAAAAACILLFFTYYFNVNAAVDAVVYLDINPSISIEVNKKSKVIDVIANNDDGKNILDDMNLKNIDINVAINAILGSMVKNGYLSDAESTLLISVSGKDENRTSALQSRLTIDARDTLSNLLGNSVILGQTVEIDADSEDISNTYGITPGKATLILRLIAVQPSWSVQELAAMPMTELMQYCRDAKVDISDYLGNTGEVIGDIESIGHSTDSDKDDDLSVNDNDKEDKDETDADLKDDIDDSDSDIDDDTDDDPEDDYDEDESDNDDDDDDDDAD